MRLSKFFGLDENNFKVCKAGDRVLITGVTDTSDWGDEYENINFL